jgi:hypothetical protein
LGGEIIKITMPKTKIKHHYSGLSLLELREKYGIGEKGFYDNDWWLKESFAKEKPPAGIYEIELHPEWNRLTYEEQLKKMGKKLEFLHPTVLAEAILAHYEKTGKRLLKDWYSRTLSVASGGRRVDVGYFGGYGLGVGGYWDDRRVCPLGVAASRKFEPRKLETAEPLNIEITEIKINNKVYRLE